MAGMEFRRASICRCTRAATGHLLSLTIRVVDLILRRRPDRLMDCGFCSKLRRVRRLQRTVSVDQIDYLVLVSRWLHIVGAVLALGGAAFALFAWLPGTEKGLPADQRESVRNAVRRRWAPVVNLAMALLLVTGFLNFYWLVIVPKVPAMPYHALFGVKLLAAFVVFFLAAALTGQAPGFASLRANSRRWLRVVLVLGITIIFISGALNQLRQ